MMKVSRISEEMLSLVHVGSLKKLLVLISPEESAVSGNKVDEYSSESKG